MGSCATRARRPSAGSWRAAAMGAGGMQRHPSAEPGLRPLRVPAQRPRTGHGQGTTSAPSASSNEYPLERARVLPSPGASTARLGAWAGTSQFLSGLAVWAAFSCCKPSEKDAGLFLAALVFSKDRLETGTPAWINSDLCPHQSDP